MGTKRKNLLKRSLGKKKKEELEDAAWMKLNQVLLFEEMKENKEVVGWGAVNEVIVKYKKRLTFSPLFFCHIFFYFVR